MNRIPWIIVLCLMLAGVLHVQASYTHPVAVGIICPAVAAQTEHPLRPIRLRIVGIVQGDRIEEDPTGLLDEGMRYRDLDTGTFITRDRAGFVDGPNLYTYVNQNPWTKFDPEGLAGESVTPEGVETEPVLREQIDLEREVENFREFTPQEQARAESDAETEKMANRVIEDLRAEANGPKKPTQTQQTPTDSTGEPQAKKDVEPSAQKQTEESKGNVKAARQQGIADRWRQEADNIRDGKPTRNWTPEQEKDILAGRVPKSVNDGKPIEGAHIEPVKDAPEKAADPKNINLKSFREHRAKGGGEHSRDPKPYDTGPTTTP